MRVSVENHYEDKAITLEGTPQHVAEELMLEFPWLRTPRPELNTVDQLVSRLDYSQSFSAEIIEGSEELHKAETGNLRDQKITPHSAIVYDMMGHNAKLAAAFEGARFLSSRKAPALEHVRRAFWDHDGDPWKTALAAHGLEVSPDNLKALHAVLELGSMKKNEAEAVSAKTVEAPNSDGVETAEMVRRAFRDRFVVPVKLNGKHAAGTLLARDEESNVSFLLKPGDSNPGPAAGVREEGASESRRESAFYHVADKLGLSGFLPETDLLQIDNREYAAMRLLPWSYKTLDWKRDHGFAPQQILGHYLAEGSLHRWALLDYVLGNPDRHANNIMVGDGREVALIDHGSAFAGRDFDPAHDKNSFVPFYLRAWVSPAVNFNRLSPDDKLKNMPRLNESRAKELRAWVDHINADDLGSIMIAYGIDPEPSLERLAKVKTMVQEQPADLAINRLWVDA